MSYQVKGAKGQAMATVFVLFFLLLSNSQLVKSEEYVVGGEKGWAIGVDLWGQDSSFSVGSVLVFNYDPKVHNVAVVDKNGYNDCEASGTVYTSGNDHIQLLHTGMYYIISTFEDDCDNNLKLRIMVT